MWGVGSGSGNWMERQWVKRWGMDDASTDARSGNGPEKGLCALVI